MSRQLQLRRALQSQLKCSLVRARCYVGQRKRHTVTACPSPLGSAAANTGEGSLDGARTRGSPRRIVFSRLELAIAAPVDVIRVRGALPGQQVEFILIIGLRIISAARAPPIGVRMQHRAAIGRLASSSPIESLLLCCCCGQTTRLVIEELPNQISI